ncbi:MAG: hypothetical protein KAR83_01490 [Thermodesulfovibrionales bacterium]|nr:hypothetical protein [Thermodesulfovibrionales bacterium]
MTIRRSIQLLSFLALLVVAALLGLDRAHAQPPYNANQQQMQQNLRMQQYNQQQYQQQQQYNSSSGSSTGNTSGSSSSGSGSKDGNKPSSSGKDEEEEPDYQMQLLNYQIQEFQAHHEKGMQLMKRKLY